MKSLNFIILSVSLILLSSNSYCQSDSVSLEVIDLIGKSTVIKIAWPTEKGKPAIGSSDSIMSTLYYELSKNEVDCPPKIEKISETVWVCGNGKRVKSLDRKLTRLLTKEWKEY
ncbi:hypothetical protein [Fluviicola sp.]|uniref:hypothetical protein n=1 Tax=Fluviicola sp. TaxID=1917219 RepID=UPI003D283DBE